MNKQQRGIVVLSLLLTTISAVAAADINPQDSLNNDSIFKEQKLGEVNVTGMGRRHTQRAMIQATKQSALVVSNSRIADTSQSNFDVVNYVGAFSVNDQWLSEWTCFDPQNASY